MADTATPYTTTTLFEELRTADKRTFKARVQFMLREFGMTLQCNRFDIGNTIERLVADVITSMKRDVTVHTNAKRIDIEVETSVSFSIKYSTAGEVRLHNSLGSNRDMSMTNTLLVSPTEWWFLDNALIEAHGIRVADYLTNRDDALVLRRSILTALKKKGYPLRFDFNLEIEDRCDHRPTYEIFYAYVCSQVPTQA